jgi:hypothetical protein
MKTRHSAISCSVCSRSEQVWKPGWTNTVAGIKSVPYPEARLGLDFEELRYLSICRDLAAPYLPEQVKKRVDESIFNFSLLMADTAYAEREKALKPQFAFFSKGRIDYSPHFDHIERLVQASVYSAFTSSPAKHLTMCGNASGLKRRPCGNWTTAA